MSLFLSCLKRLNLKEPVLVVFLSSVGSEFQSLAPAIWKVFLPEEVPSSETQGQIVGVRESLNGRKNMARRKVKNIFPPV